MSSSRPRRTPQAQSPEVDTPAPTLPNPEQVDEAAAGVVVTGEQGTNPTQQVSLSAAELRIQQLEEEVLLSKEKIAAQEKQIENLSATRPSATRKYTAEDRKREIDRLTLIYPKIRELAPFWDDQCEDFIPYSLVVGKPVTLDIFLQQVDRTYQRLLDDEKTAQAYEYCSLRSYHAWLKAFLNAIETTLYAQFPNFFLDKLEKYFNGATATLELMAERISLLQVKAFPEEYDAAFTAVVESVQSQDKAKSHLLSPAVSYLREQYDQECSNKRISAAAKHNVSKSVSDKPSTSNSNSNQAERPKPNKKRPNRKGQDRTAPQA